MTDDRLDRMGAFDGVMWGVEQDPMLRSIIVAMTVLDGAAGHGRPAGPRQPA